MTTLPRSLQFFLWAFAVVYVATSSIQVTQVDLWWQLSEGLHILRNWTVPTAPVLAFGLPATPYYDEYAGYEIVLALIYKIGGFVAIWIAFAAVYMAIIILPSATTGRYPTFDFLSTVALLLAGILVKEQMAQRPDMVAGLLLVILIAVLRKSRLEKMAPWPLVALFLLFFAWSNTHSTFIVGFFVLGLWMANELLQKWRTASASDLLLRCALPAIVVSLLAAFLNPYGPHRFLFPFASLTDPGSIALSPEMWPITDYTSFAGWLVITATALLAWGIATNRRVPLWLTLFSVFTVFMAFRHFRFVSLLAIALLFVYAERRDNEQRSDAPVPMTILKSIGLIAACLFLFFGDAFNLINNYAELQAEEHFGTHTPRFAPAMAATRVNESGARVPVLCADNVGSYISFEGHSQFRPLLDSGLSHFSSDTKRYYFLLNQRPESLARALEKLHVNYVLVNKDTLPWILTLQAVHDWKVVNYDATGMLWERAPAEAMPLAGDQREHLEETILRLCRNGDFIGAFAYGTLESDPTGNLNLLEQYRGADWPDSLFNSVCQWVDRQPSIVVQSYLNSDHDHTYPLVDAILSSRLGSDVFGKFLATNPPGPRPWFWKLLEARQALRLGDVNRAQKIFDSISPAPISSASYYELRYAIHHSGKTPPKDDDLSAYGQWQTCGPDADADAFMDTMSAKLNARLDEWERHPPQ